MMNWFTEGAEQGGKLSRCLRVVKKSWDSILVAVRC